MDDEQLDELVKLYLDEFGGLFSVYRQVVKTSNNRAFAFFRAVSWNEAKRIRDVQNTVWNSRSPVSNVDILHIITHLMDTE